MTLLEELAEANERVNAVGNEHAKQVEEMPPPEEIDMADTGVAHVGELLLGLDPADAEVLFTFARAAVYPENHPATNFLRGLLVGALWERER